MIEYNKMNKLIVPDDVSEQIGDEIIVLDEDSGTTYIFRGGKTYKLVDGKEVLVKGIHINGAPKPTRIRHSIQVA